mmetsp:Transcript_31807/g.31095  ORF Transcript_31807/g.31095 Transcript_31807/m.31095 type:complete len:129 (+) Transcript_31807:200-586(+)
MMLLDIGSHVATPRTDEDEKKLARTEFDKDSVETMEKWIDQMDEQLPPLKNFILPSGGMSAAHLHVARTICRSAERSMVDLLQKGTIDEAVYQYVNRLSDYLFTLARICAQMDGKQETVYKKGKEVKK